MLLLTLSEAEELRDDLDSLINKQKMHHAHVNDSEYNHEITVAIYDEKNLTGFDERATQLILTDKSIGGVEYEK
jgi:predicted hydrolase (HD superfamily)